MKKYFIFVFIVLIIFTGCNSSLLNDSRDTVSGPAGLTYTTTSAVYTKGVLISNNIPSVLREVTTWSISPSLPAGLSFDTSTGQISGTPVYIQSAKEYIITASNKYGSTAAVISITINLSPPVALSYTTTSAVYTKDAIIVNNTPTITGTATSWSIIPALPAGLSFNTTTGVISGTPSVSQSASNYTVIASNAYGYTTANISITINNLAPAAINYATTSAIYTKDSAITSNTPTVTGSGIIWSISPALPAGLTLNTTTGVISGIPGTTQTTKPYIVTATNSYGYTTATISIAINNAAPSSINYPTTTAIYTKDSIITYNVPTVNGSGITWSISPALPSGLTINTTTGVIYGIPETTQTTTPYMVTATNSGGSTSAAISITVNYAAPSSLNYPIVTAVYTKNGLILSNVPTVTGSGLIWSISPALPKGLTLNTTTGVISGTPEITQAATPYIVTATNSGGYTTAVILITVNNAAPANINYARTSSIYAQGVTITDNIPTIDGSGMSWSISPALPAGLTLNTTTGIISGTPETTQAATPYLVTATNSAGYATTTISITVVLSWTRLSGENSTKGYNIAVDTDGNSYVVGSTEGNLDGQTLAGYIDMFVTKYNASGEKQWTKLSGVSGCQTEGWAIALDSNNNIYVSGYTEGNLDGQIFIVNLVGDKDAFVIKYNSSGEKQWTRLLGAAINNPVGYGIAVDSSGNIYVSGSTEDSIDGQTLMGSADVFVIKYNSSGEKQWTRLSGSNGNYTEGYGIAADSSGNCYVTGSAEGNLDGWTIANGYGYRDGFVIKYNSSGEKQWTRILGADNWAQGNSITVDSSGNSYVAGTAYSNLGEQILNGYTDLFVIKYNSSGEKQWTRLLGEWCRETYGKGIAIDLNGNPYVTGFTNANLDGQTKTGIHDAFVVKYDSSGNKKWTKLLGVNGENTYGQGISIDLNAYTYIVGYTEGNLDGQTLIGNPSAFVSTKLIQ